MTGGTHERTRKLFFSIQTKSNDLWGGGREILIFGEVKEGKIKGAADSGRKA